MFAEVIRRRQEMLLARKEFIVHSKAFNIGVIFSCIDGINGCVEIFPNIFNLCR